MDSILLLVNSAPSSPNVDRTFQLALTMRKQGQGVTLFLLQDAVLAGLQRGGNGSDSPVNQALSAGISIYALGEDLALRGFTALKLRQGIQVADYGQLVDMFDRHTRVVGAL